MSNSLSNVLNFTPVVIEDAVSLYKARVFAESLVKYFKPFWDAHQLEKDWLNKDTSHYMTEDKPVFHGLVLSADNDLLSKAKGSIRKIMREAGMGMPMGHDYMDYNKAGEFTYWHLENTSKTLEELLNGRSYHLIILLQDIEPTYDLINTCTSFLFDNNPKRIIKIYKKLEITNFEDHQQ